MQLSTNNQRDLILRHHPLSQDSGRINGYVKDRGADLSFCITAIKNQINIVAK